MGMYRQWVTTRYIQMIFLACKHTKIVIVIQPIWMGHVSLSLVAFVSLGQWPAVTCSYKCSWGCLEVFEILDDSKDSEAARDALVDWQGASDIVQTMVLPVATLGAYNVDLAALPVGFWFRFILILLFNNYCNNGYSTSRLLSVSESVFRMLWLCDCTCICMMGRHSKLKQCEIWNHCRTRCMCDWWRGRWQCLSAAEEVRSHHRFHQAGRWRRRTTSIFQKCDILLRRLWHRVSLLRRLLGLHCISRHGLLFFQVFLDPSRSYYEVIYYTDGLIDYSLIK